MPWLQQRKAGIVPGPHGGRDGPAIQQTVTWMTVPRTMSRIHGGQTRIHFCSLHKAPVPSSYSLTDSLIRPSLCFLDPPEEKESNTQLPASVAGGTSDRLTTCSFRQCICRGPRLHWEDGEEDCSPGPGRMNGTRQSCAGAGGPEGLTGATLHSSSTAVTLILTLGEVTGLAGLWWGQDLQPGFLVSHIFSPSSLPQTHTCTQRLEQLKNSTKSA